MLLLRIALLACSFPAGIQALVVHPRAVNSTLYGVAVPDHPTTDRQIVDASLQSLSIEFFSFMEYSGNATYSNPLNKNLISHIRDWGGVPIKVRIGGSSQGQLWWMPNQTTGLIGYYNSGADKTYNLTVGPSFVDAFDAWPKDTEFVIGLPYPWENSAFLGTSIEVASQAYKKLGSRLIGLELGNERQDLDMSPPEFVDHFLESAYQISKAVFHDEYKAIYTIGTLLAPTLIECADDNDKDSCWSVRSFLEDGINEHNIAKVADTHQYMATFDTGNNVSRQHLLSHNITAGFVDSHYELAAYSTARGIPYILGETNSLFGHGRAGVSDAFAAALWNIDYTLYSAQTNITRLGFHQCFGWKYSAWRPIAAFGYPAGVLPSYYAFWVVQLALSDNHGTGKQVEALVTDDYFTVYAIYDGTSKALTSVIAINLLDWDSASGQTTRPEVTVDFSNVKTACGKARVKRLTAAGADIMDPENVTFAGQYIDNDDGAIQGQMQYENLGEGETLTLKASEAVVITFC